jgi:hypothetical protein
MQKYEPNQQLPVDLGSTVFFFFFSLLNIFGRGHEITKCEKQSERGNGGKDGGRPLHPAGWGGLEGVEHRNQKTK